MNTVLCLNNRAISLLQAGRYEEAISSLKNSLKNISSEMAIEQMKEDDDDIMMVQQQNTNNSTTSQKSYLCHFNFCSFETTSSSSSASSRKQQHVDILNPSSRTKNIITRNDCYQRYMFRDPIFLLPPEISDTSPSTSQHQQLQKLSTTKEQYEVVMYVIFYNLALSYHMKAITMITKEVKEKTTDKDNECNNSNYAVKMFDYKIIKSPEKQQLAKAFLEHALLFYEYAHRMLLKNEEYLIFIVMIIDNTSFLHHSMAILNNLGHAYCYLGNETKSKLFFEQLLSTMIRLVDYSGNNNRNNSHSENTSISDLYIQQQQQYDEEPNDNNNIYNTILDFDGFIQNVLPLIVSVSPPASAA